MKRTPAPGTNVRVDYAPRPRWMKRLRAGPMAIRCTRPRALGAAL